MMGRRIRIGSLSSPNFEIWNDKIDRSRQSFRYFVPMFSVQNKTFWALFILLGLTQSGLHNKNNLQAESYKLEFTACHCGVLR